MTASGCRPPEGVPAHRRVFRERKVENPEEPGLPGNLCHLRRGGGRGNRGDRPLGSKTQPLSPPPPFGGLLLTSDTSANPQLHRAPPRPRKCSSALIQTSVSRLTSGPLLPRDTQRCRKPGPDSTAAAQGPPHPRGLSGTAWSCRGCGSAGVDKLPRGGASSRGFYLWAGPSCAQLALRVI